MVFTKTEALEQSGDLISLTSLSNLGGRSTKMGAGGPDRR